jgi:excisionase family DNA binding protein
MPVVYNYVPGDWLSKSEACRLMRVKRSTLDRLIDRGLIGSRSLPGSWTKFSLADIESVLQQSTTLAQNVSA